MTDQPDGGTGVVTSRSRAEKLRAQADQLDRLASLEEDLSQAKGAYRDAIDDETAKARHREASQALADAREAIRAERAERQGATVTPDPLAVAATPGKVE